MAHSSLWILHHRKCKVLQPVVSSRVHVNDNSGPGARLKYLNVQD